MRSHTCRWVWLRQTGTCRETEQLLPRPPPPPPLESRAWPGHSRPDLQVRAVSCLADVCAARSGLAWPALQILDEAHHAGQGDHPYAKLMAGWRQGAEAGTAMPRVLGFTASPMAGETVQVS